MNWDEVSAIGQVLGSVAVFVTLIYLAIQTRHSRREVRRSVSQSRAATVRELSLLRVQDPSLCQLHVKANLALAAGGQRPPFRQALIERVGLTPAEAIRLDDEHYAWWQYRVQTIPHLEDLTDGERVEFETGVRSYLYTPLPRLWYENSKSNLNPEAVRYVDALTAQPAEQSARMPSRF